MVPGDADDPRAGLGSAAAMPWPNPRLAPVTIAVVPVIEVSGMAVSLYVLVCFAPGGGPRPPPVNGAS